MNPVHLHAERAMAVPASVVYACIANYVDHHRPGGFLPPAFERLDILEGGQGAGTVIRFVVRVGGTRQTTTQTVSEPEPGRILVESDARVTTTFTVNPTSTDSCLVQIDTLMTRSGGIIGIIEGLLIPRLLLPLYHDELARLDARARQTNSP